jgi:hypothetical protein
MELDSLVGVIVGAGDMEPGPVERLSGRELVIVCSGIITKIYIEAVVGESISIRVAEQGDSPS